MLFFFLIFGAVLLEIAADTLFKSWSLGGRELFFWFGIALYLAGTFIWAYSLKYDFLSKAISVFTILNLLAVILIGVLYFKENLSSLNKVGIVLGVVSIILLQA